MKKFRIETWQSNLGNTELQHFLKNGHETYVFGINRDLLGKKTYKEILKIVKKRLEKIHKKEPTVVGDNLDTKRAGHG